MKPSIFLLSQMLVFAPAASAYIQQSPLVIPEELATPSFTIEHIFHNTANSHTHKRLDIDEVFLHSLSDGKSSHEFSDNPFSYSFKMNSNPKQVVRMKNRDPDFVESYINYAISIGNQAEVDSMIHLEWIKDSITIPNVSDHDTILNLALMSSNAYAKLPDDPDWRDVGDHYKLGDGFGWNDTGVRGHVFVEKLPKKKRFRKPRVIIAYKGTSASGLTFGSGLLSDDDGGTVEGDKANDNLLFSCCCAHVSSLWSTVCDCYEDQSYTCNQNCLEREMRRPDRYYKAALDIYRNVTSLYPGSEIWLTGHSLGGALASLVGRTFGVPVVTFESPGELLPTKRLHLPLPPGLPKKNEYIWHFGNTADPIFLGVCNGGSSSCNMAGYAMETQCHSGLVCTYDTVKDLGWHLNMLNHRLSNVIDNVLTVYNTTPPCVKPAACVDCYNWYFVDHTGDKFGTSLIPSPSTTTTTSAAIPTGNPSKRKCLKRTWYGKCYKWEDSGIRI